MTPPSVSEEMIRALTLAKPHVTAAAADRIAGAQKAYDAIEAALSLAHLPAGSEAVKPVIYWNPQSCTVMSSGYEGYLPLYAAPPSTPPAANVQEVEALLSGHIELNMSNYTEDDVSALNEWAICAYTFLRSKQAPTVAVPDEAMKSDEDLEAVAAAIWFDGYGRHRLARGKGKWPDDVIGGSQELFRGMAAAAVSCLRARAEQREAPSVVAGEG